MLTSRQQTLVDQMSTRRRVLRNFELFDIHGLLIWKLPRAKCFELDRQIHIHIFLSAVLLLMRQSVSVILPYASCQHIQSCSYLDFVTTNNVSSFAICYKNIVITELIAGIWKHGINIKTESIRENGRLVLHKPTVWSHCIWREN